MLRGNQKRGYIHEGEELEERGMVAGRIGIFDGSARCFDERLRYGNERNLPTRAWKTLRNAMI